MRCAQRQLRDFECEKACPLYPGSALHLEIFLDAFVIGDQPEGKAKDHSDVVYSQNDNPAVRGTWPEFF